MGAQDSLFVTGFGTLRKVEYSTNMLFVYIFFHTLMCERMNGWYFRSEQHSRWAVRVGAKSIPQGYRSVDTIAQSNYSETKPASCKVTKRRHAFVCKPSVVLCRWSNLQTCYLVSGHWTAMRMITWGWKPLSLLHDMGFTAERLYWPDRTKMSLTVFIYVSYPHWVSQTDHKWLRKLIIHYITVWLAGAVFAAL